MNTVAPVARKRDSQLSLYGVLAGLALALLWFVSSKIHYLTDYSPASYGDFWSRRVGLIPHLLGGLLAITAGLVQLWLGLTHRVSTLHRVLGKVYGLGVLVGSLGGFYLALTIASPLSYSAGLFMLCVAWLITTGMALYAIRSRRIEQHREWMLRSYTVTFAFVTFRLGSAVLRHWLHRPGADAADDIDVMMAWAAWAVPLLLAEPLIQLRAMRQRRAVAG